MPTVKINNLPRWISEIHLKQFFSSCGKICNANIAKDQVTLRPLGYGYLEFADNDAVQSALEKDGCRLDGEIIQIELMDQMQPEANI